MKRPQVLIHLTQFSGTFPKASGEVHGTVLMTTKSVVARHPTNNNGASEGIQGGTTAHGGSATLTAIERRKDLNVLGTGARHSTISLLSKTTARQYTNEWLRLALSSATYASDSLGTTPAFDVGALQ